MLADHKLLEVADGDSMKKTESEPGKFRGLSCTTMTTFKTIFLTVGTTRFDALIEAVDSVEFQRLITKTLKTTRLVVQCGNSAVQPQSVKI